MTSIEINNQIKNYERIIHNLQGTLIEKRKDLNQLYDMEEEHKRKSQLMNSRFENELANLRNLENFPGIKMVAAYNEDMKNLLTGTSAQSYFDAIESISNKIAAKITDIEEEILGVQAQIRNYENLMENLNKELKLLQEVSC